MSENQSHKAKVRQRSSDIVGALLAIVFLPLLLVLGIFYLTYSILLNITIWMFYCSRGTNVLFIYSNSPIWKDYVEANILPKLPTSTITLNWSERSQWKSCSLSTIVFRHFGGDTEYNPMGIVFRPWRRAKVFKFWKPFKDFKHGNTDSLNKLQSDFLNLIQQQR